MRVDQKMPGEENPAMNNAKILKTILVVLIAIVIPVTVVVLQERQTIEQQAQTASPSVNGFTITSPSQYAGDSRNNTLTVSGTGAQYRVYIHGTNPPQPNDPSLAPYTPGGIIQANAFYQIGIIQSGQSFSFIHPATAGTYYIAVNAESAPDGSGRRTGCDWNGRVYIRNADGSFGGYDPGGATCTTQSPRQINVIYTSVSSVDVAPVATTYQPGASITVSAFGGANKHWLYLHTGPDTPLRSDPVVQDYNPSSLNNNTFYRFAYRESSGGQTVSAPLTLPTRVGTYYLVSNAHANVQEGLPWHPLDRTCAWDSRVYLYNSAGTIDIGAACNNFGPKMITVGSAQTTPILTPTGTQATATPVPGNTRMTVYLLLHGIGAAGDSVNSFGPGNRNPITRTKPVSLQLLDASNTIVAEKTGTIDYMVGPDNFAGTVDISGVADGTYTVKVKTERYLRKKYPGTQQVTNGQIIQLPQMNLVVGDANNDNALNIMDYNILLDCFSDLAPPLACSDPAKKLSVDFTDDGNVNGDDFNLFLREVGVVQFGD